VSLRGPNIYPSSGVWTGISRELSPDTPLLPVVTHPVEEDEESGPMTKEELRDKIDWEGGGPCSIAP
jgi:hypothetical protein